MANSRDYIIEYGNVTFEDYPFTEADALTLAQIFYMPYEKVISPSFDAQPVNFSDASIELFNMMGGKYQKLGLMIPKDASKNIMLMSSRKRFSAMKIAAVEELLEQNPAVQYAAGTFLLPDGTAVIVFRGTDDTLAGWKEDLDIFIRKGIPSYGYADEYLKKAAEKFDGNIILCGHSKGGNVALHAAIKCSKEIRARISGIYNFDGPGFHNSSVLNTAAYDEIKPVYHHFVPYGSMIGMMLAHDYDYTACANKMPIGLLQHDLGQWVLNGSELERVEDTDRLSKATDILFANICNSVDPDTCRAVDELVSDVIAGIGKITLTDFSKMPFDAVKGAITAYKAVAPEIREQASSALHGITKKISDAAKSAKLPDISSITSLLYAN